MPIHPTPASRPRVAIIGSVGVPGQYGGFETLAHHLVLQLSGRYELTVVCSGKAYEKSQQVDRWEGAELRYLPLEANGVQSIPYDTWSMLSRMRKDDLLLVLGVSGGWFLPWVKRLSSAKLLVNIDGLEWKRDKWGKRAKAYLRWAEEMAARHADGLVADNAVIQQHISEAYGKPAHLIAYGGDHTSPIKVEGEDLLHYPFLQGPYAFKVCRIEPENHVHLILEAFTRFEGYPLVLVGNWEYSEYGRSLYQRYRSHPNLILLPPIYDPRGLNLLRSNARIYVHGHEAGGTNPSLVEAMSLGLPVLAFDVSYNRETTANQAFYFASVEGLVEALDQIDEAMLARNARHMQVLAATRYTWRVVAEGYEQAIRHTLGLPVEKPLAQSI